MSAQDKIRELCKQVSVAQNEEAANRILPELREALHEHCEGLRLMVAKEYPFHKNDAARD
jgi:hypothetical protein